MPERTDYPHLTAVPTRWRDNDIYGHVNNIEYYSFFDTAINAYLIASSALDIHAGPLIGLCAESHCRFLAEISFPETVEVGLRVDHLGNTSVRYGLAIFRDGQNGPAAEGWFVHVFIDRLTRRPKAFTPALRTALEALVLHHPEDPGSVV